MLASVEYMMLDKGEHRIQDTESTSIPNVVRQIFDARQRSVYRKVGNAGLISGNSSPSTWHASYDYSIFVGFHLNIILILNSAIDLECQKTYILIPDLPI